MTEKKNYCSLGPMMNQTSNDQEIVNESYSEWFNRNRAAILHTIDVLSEIPPEEPEEEPEDES